MFIRLEIKDQMYVRTSKLGIEHEYMRKKTLVVLRCDNCKTVFTRDKGSLDPRRLNNSFFHCCTGCDTKRFAQRKGIERRTVWDMPASSMKDISEM
jgi:hypothetical protein